MREQADRGKFCGSPGKTPQETLEEEDGEIR